MPTEQNSHDNVTAVALRAISLAQQYSHETVTSEHILVALLERQEIEKCLKDLNVDIVSLQKNLIDELKVRDNKLVALNPNRTREFDIIMARTIAYSQFSPRRFPTGIDVLFQLLLVSENSYAIALLTQAGVDARKIKSYILQGLRQTHRQDGEYSNDVEPTDKPEALTYIKKYCIDFNEMARLGKIDAVVGRLSELERVTQIIARRTKNNVALVGEPGVGKTAIIEGLAYNIVNGNTPSIFTKSTVWSLDVGSLVAGTRFRGDFEERMKFLLKAFSLIEDDEPILFIDEIHTIMDAGSGNKGSLDVSNLLKPALARGRLRCIGSTTDKDWRQHFEKDRALLRRFKKLYISEPSVADAKLILRGLRASYETFHEVRYTEEALDAAVDLTVRYIHDGKLPDKAIDVIDEAGARQRIAENAKSVIDVTDIELEVSLVAKIPPQNMHQDEADRLQRLEEDLRTVVFGQDAAIKHLVNAVLIGRAGLRDVNKPEGCFLFTGPTGVGKSESVRQLAKTLGLPLIKFDMSEYMESHAGAKLIGSPPGYVGFGDGAAGNGLLINAIDSTPSCVLLLDEIEKAHPDIFNIFLQVMEDATLTNSIGKSVSFRNVILVMTSNAGVAKTEKHGIGFVTSEDVTIDDNVVKQIFSPEFRNRLDAIVLFNALDHASITKVVQKFVSQLQVLLQERGVRIELTDAAKKWLADKGHDPVYGARPLNRLITEKIKQPLSRLMLFGELKQGGIAKVSVEDGKLIVRAI